VNIKLPSGITAIAVSLLYGCSNLTAVEIPSNVASIGSFAFYGCSNLTAMQLPSKVTELGQSAFSGCSKMTSINMQGLKTLGKSAFSGCSSITSLTIPSGLKNITERAFGGLGIATLTVPSSVEEIGPNAFSGCTKLQTVTIKEGPTIIKKQAFSGCSVLKNISIPASVETIEYNLFRDDRQMKSINVNKRNQYFTSIDGVLFTKNKTVLVEYPNDHGYNYIIPNGVQVIGYGAFAGCEHNLRTVVFPETVHTIDAWAFEDVWGMEDLVLPASLKHMGHGAFANDGFLRTVTFLGLVNPEGGDKYTFTYCRVLGTPCVPVNYVNTSFCGKDVYATNDTFDQFRNQAGGCETIMVCGSRVSDAKNYSVCNRGDGVNRTCINDVCVIDETSSSSVESSESSVSSESSTIPTSSVSSVTPTSSVSSVTPTSSVSSVTPTSSVSSVTSTSSTTPTSSVNPAISEASRKYFSLVAFLMLAAYFLK